MRTDQEVGTSSSTGFVKGDRMKLDVGRHPSNRAIYLAALDRTDGQERQAFLKRACGGDAERHSEIQRLLAAHGNRAGSPVDRVVDPPSPATGTVSTSKTGIPASAATFDFDVSKHPLIDQYKLLEQIGEGGMGAVFMAQQTEPIRRKVALKLIKPGLDSCDVISRFQAERQALAMMDHPNIARVLDAGATAEGRPYFVMELVRGIPITDFCDENRLSVNDRLRLFNDVCRAVQHAHQKGIIHRDLKPSNVMVTLHDVVPVVKVIDFGVAKALDQELNERTLFTHFSQMIGTPLYMSPEQAEMSGLDIDTRSDIYSLGVLLYELLTGTTPFDKEMLSKAGFDGMRRIIREAEPPRPSHKLSTLDAQLLSTVLSRRKLDARQLTLSIRRELDWVAMKALEKDRSRRYESASMLAADVQRYLDGEAVLAHPPSVAYRMRKVAARHRGALVAALLILAVLLGGTTASIWQAVRAHHARRVADIRTQQAQDQQQIAERQTRLARSERDRASRASDRAQRLLYTSDMKLASDAIANEDLPRAGELLQRHIPSDTEPDLRGFEWHFFRKRVAGPEQITFEQGDWIRDIRCSPDGKWLAITAAQGAVRIYEVETWQVRHMLISGADKVNGLAWSHDGRLLATASADGNLHIWNVLSGEQQIQIVAHNGGAKDVVFSPDSRILYSCGDDHRAYAWEVETGVRQLTFSGHEREVERIALSPDGKTLATASSDRTFGIWDAASADQLHSIKRTGSRVVCVAFSPNGRWVAAGDIHGGIYLADRETGKGTELVQQLDGIEALAFVPGSTQLATADRGGAIQLHPVPASLGDSPAPAAPSPRWMAHEGRALSIAISPDGKQFFSGGRDGLLQVWKPNPDAFRWTLKPLPINDFATGPKNQLYAAGKKIHQWDLNQRQLVNSFAPTDSPWRLVECASDGRHLAAARHGQLALFDVTSQSLQRTWSVEDLDPHRLAMTADGRLAALADWTNRETILLFDLRAARSPRHLPALQCDCLAFSADGEQLAVGTRDDLWVYDLGSDAEPTVLRGHSNTLSGVAFSPDGNWLATISHDRLLKIWRAATGEERFSVVAHRSRIASVDFSPDGRTIATAGYDGMVKLWHTETGQPVGAIGPEGNWISELRFTADGQQLAIHLVNDPVIVYDASTLATARTVAEDSDE